MGTGRPRISSLIIYFFQVDVKEFQSICVIKVNYKIQRITNLKELLFIFKVLTWGKSKISNMKQVLVMAKDFIKNPKVSVIIPIYNVEKYLCQCLNCVIHQTLRDIEIICIDDGSTDSSAKILQEYAAKDKRIKVISKQNEGVGKARNDGILQACGQYVIFLDPDDLYPTSKVLSILYNKAVKHNALICGGEFALFSEDVSRLDQNFGTTFEGYLFDAEQMCEYSDYQFDYGYHRFIYNRQMLLKHKIFYPPYKRFQDPPFFVKAMITSQRFYALDTITYAYRVGHQNVNWDNERICGLLNGLKDNFEMAAKHNLERLNHLTYQRFLQHYEQIKNGLSDKTAQKLLRKLCKYNAELEKFCLQNNVFTPSKATCLKATINKGYENMKQWIKKLCIPKPKKQKIIDENIEKHSHAIKLFFFFPLYSRKQFGGRTTWNVLGLPIFKRRQMANGIATKYYILGLQVLKISRKLV